MEICHNLYLTKYNYNMATPDRITTLKQEIKEYRQKLKDLEYTLLLLEKIPHYLQNAIKILRKHFGENPEWEANITETIKENLQSIPEIDWDNDTRKINCSYKWDGIDISYYVYYDDDTDVYFEDKSAGCPDWVRIESIYIYHEKKWDNFKYLDNMHIPILIGYMTGKLSGIDNLDGVYEEMSIRIEEEEEVATSDID